MTDLARCIAPPASAALEAVARRALEALGQVTGLESTYLTFIDWTTATQEVAYARNVGAMEVPEGLRVPWADTLCRRALEGGPACTADVPGLYPESRAASELGIRTYITAPISGPDGAVLGTVCGASAASVDLSDTARLVLEALAEMIALQLAHDAAADLLAHQAQLLELANAELARLACIDGLTGVTNRRGFDQALAHTCAEAARRHGAVGLVALDVDLFKAVNDRLGHAAGDAVLVAIADELQRHARGGDVVGRLGGDEFVLILQGGGRERAAQVAERVRSAIASNPIDTVAGPVAVSVSVGVASRVGAEPEALLRCVDEALYAAKAAGRDRVVGSGCAP